MSFSFSRRAAIGVLSSTLLALGACTKSEPVKTDAPAAKAGPGATSANAAPDAKNAPTKSATVPDAVKKLFGRWMRIDGGYVLELRGADISGVLDAGYFNPKSIRVSRAAWMQGGAGLQVMIELNDVGYPGATYVLTHDPQNDRLVGTYTQPQMQQSFEIEFIRQPKQ